MKKIFFDDFTIKKTDYDIKHNIYDINLQYDILQNIDTDLSHNAHVKKEILKKYYSYKSQDKKKNKYDKDKHITYAELISKLKDSQLKCYYCNNNLYLVYKKKNEPLQWSLERYDNNIGHYNKNTCITCLKCNLDRRTSNYEYFKFSKNLSVVKKETTDNII